MAITGGYFRENATLSLLPPRDLDEQRLDTVLRREGHSCGLAYLRSRRTTIMQWKHTIDRGVNDEELIVPKQ